MCGNKRFVLCVASFLALTVGWHLVRSAFALRFLPCDEQRLIVGGLDCNGKEAKDMCLEKGKVDCSIPNGWPYCNATRSGSPCPQSQIVGKGKVITCFQNGNKQAYCVFVSGQQQRCVPTSDCICKKPFLSGYSCVDAPPIKNDVKISTPVYGTTDCVPQS